MNSNRQSRKYFQPFDRPKRVLAEERRQKLADSVKQKGYVSLIELVQLAGVSESTVRRDLDYLHETGRLKRTHGGAIAVGVDASLPAFEERSDRQAQEKQRISYTAAKLFKDGETILLDGGTTTFELARQLVGRHLQIVTNSLPIANLFASNRDVDLVFIGGYIYPRTGVALGPIAHEALKHLHVHRLVMSVSGLTERGLFNDNLLLVETQQAMMRAAGETIVLADHTKFGKQALAYLCDWSKVNRIIVDDGMRSDHLALIAKDVEIITSAIEPVRRIEHRNITLVADPSGMTGFTGTTDVGMMPDAFSHAGVAGTSSTTTSDSEPRTS